MNAQLAGAIRSQRATLPGGAGEKARRSRSGADVAALADRNGRDREAGHLDQRPAQVIDHAWSTQLTFSAMTCRRSATQSATVVSSGTLTWSVPARSEMQTRFASSPKPPCGSVEVGRFR